MHLSKNYNLITVLGPTASGKTRFAACLAKEIEGEIISADSRQVYRKMDIGTGKDYRDYIVNDWQVPYHLVDIVDPGYEYNVYEYQRDFVATYQDITNRKKFPVLCGGSGLYIEAVLKGYKLINVPVNSLLRKELDKKSMEELTEILVSFKKLHNKTDIETRKRLIRAIEIEEYYNRHPENQTDYPELNTLIIGIHFDRETRRMRITERLMQRFEGGMIKEVKKLLDSGLSYDQLIYYGLEYKYITLYLRGDIDYESMVNSLNTAIHQLAKRQMTWFRRMERNGIKIHWLDGQIPIKERIEKVMALL